MIRRSRLLTLLLALVLSAPAVYLYAQTAATSVQHSPAHIDSAARVDTSATSAATITLTPNGGELVYIYEIDVQNCAGSAAVTAAAQTSITTTNLTGTPAWMMGSGTTAGACTQVFSGTYPTGLKAQAVGTAVTFVLPTFATNQTIRLNVAWRSAPIQ